MRARRIATACAALLLAPAGAAAQWTVEAAAGRAVHDPVSARVLTSSASLGLSYEGDGGQWGYVSGGAPLEGAGPAWGAGGAGAWLGIRRAAVQVGVSASAHGYAYGRSGPNPAGSGGTVHLLPTLSVRAGALAAEVSSGFSGAVDVLGDSTDQRAFHESTAQLALSSADGVTLAVDGRLLRGDGGDWPYAGGSAELRRGWGAAWIYAGTWLGDDHPRPAAAYGAGLRLRVLPRTDLQGTVRQEPFDPLYWTAPRRTWSVSVSRSLGRPPRAERRAPGLPVLSEGWAVFRLSRARAAEAPVVIGDFSAWEPVAMTDEGDAWVARVRVDPGAYHYAFRTADGQVVVPEGVPTVDDGFGGRSAVLVVP